MARHRAPRWLRRRNNTARRSLRDHGCGSHRTPHDDPRLRRRNAHHLTRCRSALSGARRGHSFDRRPGLALEDARRRRSTRRGCLSGLPRNNDFRGCGPLHRCLRRASAAAKRRLHATDLFALAGDTRNPSGVSTDARTHINATTAVNILLPRKGRWRKFRRDIALSYGRTRSKTQYQSQNRTCLPKTHMCPHKMW